MKSRQRCLIALGGNLGPVEESFRSACTLLQENGVEVEHLSSFRRTAPMGADAGQEFLNAAAVVISPLSAADLLRTLHMIEHRLGRTRTVHWGPRTIDLDLLLYGGQVIQQPDLVVPHPAMWYRRFALEPAAEIAGDMNHPTLRESVSELWHRLCRRPLIFQVCVESAGGLAAAEQSEAARVDLTALEQICRQWTPEGATERILFRPVHSGKVASSDVFATIRLLKQPLSADAPTGPLTAAEFCRGREFVVPFHLEPSAGCVVRDVVIAALGADAAAD